MQQMQEKERLFRSDVFVLGGVQLVDWGREGQEEEKKGKERISELMRGLIEV